jgi:F-type H+-transporting ATPase subunit delta
MAVFAARYARALADVVLDAKLNTAEVEQQLEDFAATFAGSKDLREILLNPSIPAKQRVAILDKVNGRIGCGPKVRNFLAVLIRHERLGALTEILEEYRLEMNRRLSISDAEVVTTRRSGTGKAGRASLRACRQQPGQRNFPRGQVAHRRSDRAHWQHHL